jgi:UDP-N-acetyl-D-glucosamine dehydrogenase
VASFKEDGHEMKSVAFGPEQVAAADCVMIVTDHSSIDYRMVRDKARLVVDTRHAMPKAGT